MKIFRTICIGVVAVFSCLPTFAQQTYEELEQLTVNEQVTTVITASEPIRFENGLPVTQGDRRFHGFGMKSIKYVCDRYGADLTVKAENNMFTINILFLPKDREGSAK